jgi:hypothetical protein
MKDQIEFVVEALTAGAAAKLGGTTSQVIEDAYTKLKSTTRTLLHRDSSVDAAEVDRYLANPQEHRGPLGEALATAGAGTELTAAAQLVMVLMARTAAPSFHFNGNRGIQIGDNGQMTVNG